MKNVIIKTSAMAAAFILLTLSGCGKSYVNYSSSDGAYSLPQSGKLPASHGGYRKTGKPYQVAGRWYYPLATANGYKKTGTASWYGRKFHGRKTANGERYNMHAMSAAHKTLPLPTMVRVTNLNNGRSVVVRVNDRGPFVKNRLIDLSYAAAKTLGYDHAGTAPVRVEVLGHGTVASNALRNHSQKPAQQLQLRPQHKSAAAVSTFKSGGMYIQLGAFSSHDNARRMKQSLKNSYPSVNIYAKNAGYSEIYRVRIGPFNDVQRIENNVLSLQERGYDNAIVVIE